MAVIRGASGESRLRDKATGIAVGARTKLLAVRTNYELDTHLPFTPALPSLRRGAA